MPTEAVHRTMSQDDKSEEKANIRENVIDVEDRFEEYEEYLTLEEAYQGERLSRLTRKVDWHVLPQLIFIYLLSYVDRSNVGNAKLFGAIKDLHLSNQGWNTGLTLFFITYALGGPPCTMVLRRFGPKKVLPSILFCVSLILIGSGCANSEAQWYALRMLLGLFEAGMFPGCAYTLTTWYPPHQLAGRLAFFYCGGSLAGAFSGLLAYAIGQADGVWGYRGWRWIYVIEGLFSFFVSVGAFFVIQERPENQGKWLTMEERRYLVLRVKFAYGTNKKGSSTDFRLVDFVKAMKSIHVHFMGFAFFCFCVAIYGLSFTLPTIVSNMGFTAAKAQALSAPPYVFASLCVVLCGWMSDRYRARMWSIVIPSVVAFTGLLICLLTVKHKHLIPLTYIGVCLGAAGLYCLSPVVSAWAGVNAAGPTKRAAAISIITFCSQLGGIVGSNIYLAKESPGYHTGFGVSLATLGLGCIVCPFVYAYWLKRINAQRDQMTEEEIAAKYSPEELELMGDLSPMYRYET